MSDQVLSGLLSNRGDLTDFAVATPTAVAEPARLAVTSLPTLLAWIGSRRASGSLVVSARDGRVFDVSVSSGSLGLIERRGESVLTRAVEQLVASKAIDPLLATRAEQVAVASGRSLVQVLLEMDACPPRLIVDGIREVKQAVLDELLAPGETRYEWAEGAPPRHKADPVTLDVMLTLMNLLRHRMRMSYSQDLDPLLAPWMQRFPVKSPILTPPVASACLDDKERRVLDQLADGSLSLREVFTMSLLSRTMTSRMFVACTFLGLVDYREKAVPKGGPEVVEAEVRKAFERIQHEDYFDRLGIHFTTHPAEIMPAYKKVLDRWGPGSIVRNVSPEATELCDRIVDLVEEAARTLVSPEARHRYRNATFGEQKVAFSAEFLYKQAHMAIFRNEMNNAIALLEAAIDCLPHAVFLRVLEKVKGGGKDGSAPPSQGDDRG